MFEKSVADLGRALAAKQVSAVELAKLYLERIERHKQLNAFLDVRPDVTLAQARDADRRIGRGDASPLTGVPVRTRTFSLRAISRPPLLRACSRAI